MQLPTGIGQFDDWSRVIWSDETKVFRISSDACSWWWAEPHRTALWLNSLLNCKAWQRVHNGIGGVSVRMGLGIYAKSMELWIPRYTKLSSSRKILSIDEFGFDQSHVIFQHDNDPKHTSKLVLEWLGEQKSDVLTWLPRSPDSQPK